MDEPAAVPVSIPDGAAWARLVFVDVFGGAHAVSVPAAQLPDAYERGIPFDGSALEGRSRHIEVDMLLKPDPATVLTLGGGEVRVVCAVASVDGEDWPGDPRVALQHIVADAGDLGEEMRASAELEYYLLDASGAPVDRGDYFGDLDGPGAAVTRAAAERMRRHGVEVVSAHLEAGDGQYELDFASMPLLALADALVLAKGVVRAAAREHGLTATFMARPLADQPGSGLHIHQHAGGHLFGPDGDLDGDGKAVVHGQLAHVRAICALAAPTINSYKRLHAGPEAPGPIVWGHRNRNAVIRVGSSVEQLRSIEFRLPDPSANPYLVLGALLVAATDGLEVGGDPGPPAEEDLGGFDPSAAKLPVHLLPRTLDEALDALLADDIMIDAFDGRLVARMVDGRRAEAAGYRAQITPWELDRYLDV